LRLTSPPELHSPEQQVEAYLRNVMSRLSAPRSPASPIWSVDGDVDALAQEIFELVTSREFCHLSRTRTAPYREETLVLLRRRIESGGPFRFFYDIGPGYHATTRPGETGLRFDVGLSELLILFQIASLSHRISELYPPAAHFWLVIDNLCGLRTNDIPVERTSAYVDQLRELIRESGLDDRVELIVESEEFDLEEYDRLLAGQEPQQPLTTPSAEAHENVERFLGRRCSIDEAAERIERYRRATNVTDYLLTRLVSGVHMTQRATVATIGFRPFPGGDSRAQCGEVALARNSKGKLRPVLLTSRNVNSYELTRLRFPELLPPTVEYVTYAEQSAAEPAAQSCR
jgi:hypothetical protein